MPGKCKFQDAWLAKDIYKDWLVKDPHDIQLARCKACCKAIKLQTMGEAALTSHAVGNGHKAAVRKLVEGNIVVMNVRDHVNGYGSIKDVDDKEQVALILHLNSFDRMTGSDPSAVLDHGGVAASSAAHSASFQEPAFPSNFINSRSVGCGGPRVPAYNHNHPGLLQQLPLPHPSPTPARRRLEPRRDAAPSPRTPRSVAPALARRDRGERERVEALKEKEAEERLVMLVEQQQQQQQAGRREEMDSLEWERRMRVLAWEQEVLREKGKAARQKARAYRMKRRYYGAKLKRMGQDVPPPSSSSSDEGEWGNEEWGNDAWGNGEHTPKEGH
ncbi:hypothetical protein NHX12_013370 [Muraenolepis orangiensis]|uniref:Uncharacterized protein n=1 Tax=Muraenolepis orangiensis TaxID=630683 RepID=A0A9Q0DEK5_9TELE|nr:hypothetical protein NHX12_013370 [Muraenolepis orangiensis]